MKKNALFTKDFTILVVGQIISLFGNSILRFSLSLFVLDKTGSAAVFGGILAVSMIPTILLSPFGGILADRVNRRNIMVTLDFSTALLIAVYTAFFAGSGSLAPITVTMILLAVIQSFYQPSVQASIPVLANDENLERANGAVIQVNALANLVGPIIGGFLYGFLGIQPILLASGVCFFISAVMEIFLYIPFAPQEQKGGLFRTVKDDFGSALRFVVKENPRLFQLLGVLAALNLFLSSLITVGLPYLIKVYLGLSSQHYGFAEGALALGSILGGVFAGLAAKRFDFRHSYQLLFFSGAAMVPIGLAVLTNSAPLISYGIILIAVLACMCCATLFNIFAQSFAQRQTPEQLLGKVSSLITVICICAYPVGQSFYGLLFDRFQNQVSYIVFFGCAASLLVAFAAGKIQRMIPVSHGEQSAQAAE